jgi:putative ATP-dependent endonuclease of the OLD family
MPVEFRFSKLSIRGFRGIRELEVDLPASKPLYLIGGNNSGKSTVLEAAAFALNGGGFHQFVSVEFDFFHDSKGKPVANFTVTLSLAADDDRKLPAVQGVGPPVRVHGVEVRGLTDAKGGLSHRRVLLDSGHEHILLSDKTPLKGAAKQEFKGMGLGYRQFYARLDQIRDYMPEVWLLTPQNLQRSLYEWKTGPLQRLSRLLAARFMETKWELDYEGKPRKMPETMLKTHELFRHAVEAFPFWQKDLKPRLEDTLSRYVGGQARFALRPDVQEVQEWLTQQLAVSFAADIGGAATPLPSMGDGWQSLIRLAALDVLSQYPGEVSERVLLLVEEPETHLHPHLRRKLRDVLERLAGQGWIVLGATHGPEFVSFASPQVIVKLWRKGDDVAKGVLDTAATSAAVRFQEKLEERGNHEMLFAQRAVLCEGKDDCWAIRSALAKLDPSLDLDARSISLVDAGSVGNLPDYADIAKRLGTPWCAISDEDKLPGGAVNQATEKVRQRVDAMRGAADSSMVWPGKLEICLGVPGGQKATPEWQAANVDPKPLTQMHKDHPNFMAVCDSIRGWILA